MRKTKVNLADDVPILSGNNQRNVRQQRYRSSSSYSENGKCVAPRPSRGALSNWQTKMSAAKTNRRANLTRANQDLYFQGRLPTTSAQRAASESGSDQIRGYATRSTVTATGINARKRLRPSTALRH